MKRHSLIATLLGMLILPLVVSCTKPDDGGGTTNPTDPETPVTPITPIDPVNPSEPTEVWGVYNPGKKIRKVYESQEGQPRRLREVWNWNGNLLESIDHYNYNGTISYRELYAYENNRIKSVETLGGHERCTTYEYEGNYLAKAVTYEFGFVSMIETFVYENGKLIICEMDNYTKSNNQARGDTPKAVKFLWTGDNVITTIATDDNNFELWRIDLLYDTRNNPFRGFLNSECPGTFDDDDPFLFPYSKNNIVKVQLPRREEIAYIYQYDDDGFPIERIEKPNDEYVFYEYE